MKPKWLISIIVILLLAAGGLVLFWIQDEPEHHYDDNPPSQEEISQMDPKPRDGRFVVPSVGLDAPLGDISIPASNVINPPDFERVFIFRDFAQPGEDGTVYAATHSLRGSNAPGNKLIDIDQAAPAVDPGEEIIVDDIAYTVEESYRTSKDELPADAELWDESIDNRLVLITCLQPQQGRSVDNVVTIAHRADS